MRKVIFYAIYCIVLLMVTFAALEIALRLMPGYSTNNLFFVDAGTVQLGLREPNSKTWSKNDIVTQVQYNNHGFHDYDFPSEKNESSVNIGFIGDSYVEGAQVPTDSTFTEVLEKKLNQSTSGVGINVYNFGVSGTGNAYQYALWEHYLKGVVDVDYLFICLFLGNDLDNNNPFANTHPNRAILVNEDGGVYQVSQSESSLKTSIKELRNYSVAFNTFYELLYRFKRDDVNKEAQTKLTPQSQVTEHMSEQDSLVAIYTMRLIKKWVHELREANIVPAFMIFDHERYYHWGAQKQFFLDEIEKFSSNEGIIFVKVDHQNNKQTHYVNGEGHYNTLGHEITADILYKALIKEIPTSDGSITKNE